MAGVYYHAASGRYFELKEDKSVTSGFAELPHGGYIFAAEGYIVFDDGAYCGVENGTILLGETEYKKAEKIFRLSFYSDGELIGTVGVPENAAGIALETPKKQYHTFVGWKLDGAPYDFSAKVQKDLRLDAEYRFNHVADYAPYLKGYYNAVSGTLYNLKADGEATVLANGSAKKAEYSITEDKTLLIDGKAYAIDGYHSLTGGAEKFTFLRSEYQVVFDMNGGGEEKEVTVFAKDDYLLSEIEAPVRAGYLFKGWKTATGEKFDFSTPITCATTLFADWEYVQGEANAETGGCSSSAAGIVTALSGLAAAIFAVGRKRKEN